MIFIFFLILMAVPFLISILIIQDNDNPDYEGHIWSDIRMWFSIAANIAAESIVYYLSMQKNSIIQVMLNITSHTLTYQDIYRWCRASMVCVPIAVIIGVFCRRSEELVGPFPEIDEIIAVFSGKSKRGPRRKKRNRHLYRSVSPKTVKVIFLITAAYSVVNIMGGYVGLTGSHHITLQEICRKQLTMDDDDDCSYFVLYNSGSLPCETEGLFLSTDEDDLREYSLLRNRIPSKDGLKVEIPFLKSIEIKKEGGTTVFLSNPYGDILDDVDVPALAANISYILQDTEWKVFELPDDRIDYSLVDEPEFSAEGGFYENSFQLTLSSKNNTTIYYTLDGSIPTAENGLHYTRPIDIYDRSNEPNQIRSIQNVQEEYLEREKIGQEKVDKAFVVRAIAVDESGNSSKTVTQTYFVGLDDYKDKTVVSLVSDPNGLFDNETGIYVTGTEYDDWYTRKLDAEKNNTEFTEEAPLCNFMQRGKNWERAANIEMYDNAGSELNQIAGLRIAGSSSRARVLKRFSLIARKEYSGSSVFESALFGNKETHSIRFRENFDDAFSNALVSDRDLATLAVRPVTVFLNGEYWYETYIQEKYGDRFFSETFDIAKDDIEYIEIGYFSNLSEEERAAYEEILSLAQEADFRKDKDYDSFNEIVDIQSYIDYTCCQAYLGNADSHEKLNTAIWRTSINEFSNWGDGRWRWALYDMDLNRHTNRYANGYKTDAEVNSFRDSRSKDWPSLLKGGVLWEALKKSPIFCKQFVLTFMDLVNTNFEVGHVTSLLEEWGEDISYDDYFFRERAGYITKYMAEEFDLIGTQEMVSINTDNPDYGTVVLNTISPDLSSGNWTGKYYTDYPITLEAKASKGHKFVGWNINGEVIEKNSIEVTIQEGGSEIYAIFE